MLDFEQVIKQDVEDALTNHYGYGKESVKQFWELEGEAITNKVYSDLAIEIVQKTNQYESTIGDIEL